MPNNKNKKGGGARRGFRGNPGVMSVTHPPLLRPAIRMQKIFRYNSNAAVATSVSVALLLDTLAVATAAGAAYRLIRSFRLIKVEAWSIPNLGGGEQTISITGTGAGPENRANDTSMGVSPAHVVWRPAAGSPSAFWQESGTNEASLLFFISCPSTTVIDVCLEFILQCDTVGTAVSSAVAGATAGVLYLAPLDGTAGGKMPPTDYAVLP